MTQLVKGTDGRLYERCPQCRGAGKKVHGPGFHTPCAPCNGVGYLPVDEPKDAA